MISRIVNPESRRQGVRFGLGFALERMLLESPALERGTGQHTRLVFGTGEPRGRLLPGEKQAYEDALVRGVLLATFKVDFHSPRKPSRFPFEKKTVL